jgi:KDO2-lipid IV(A) lauroyltransferase
MRNWIEFVAFNAVRTCILLLPLTAVQYVGKMLGTIAYYAIGSRRHIAIDNLQHAFPDASPRELKVIAKGAFRNYGITMMEFLWFPRLTDDRVARLVNINNPELLKDGFSRGKGMVMLSGHFGNWELIAFAVAYLCKIPFAIIIQTQSNALVDKVINTHRCLRGNKVIPMGMSVREIIKTLNSGGVVAIAPDQSGPMEGAFVEFFGRSVATHQGPAVFALRSGAPLQMGFIIRRHDGSYDVQLEEIASADLTGLNEENVRTLTQRHTALLERYIRKYPDHWLWMHRRWKHTWESVQKERQAV